MMSDAKFLVLNKESDWKKGLEDNLSFSDNGLGLLQNIEYAVNRTVSLRGVEGLSLNLDFVPGKCNVIYILDRTYCTLSAYDLEYERTMWCKSLRSLGLKLSDIAFGNGNFYITTRTAQNSGMRIISVDQLDYQVRWMMGSKAVMLQDGTPVDINPLSIAVNDKGNAIVLSARYDEADDSYSDAAVIELNRRDYVISKTPVNAPFNAETAILAASNGIYYILDSKNRSLITVAPSGETVADVPFEACSICAGPAGVYLGDGSALVPGEEDNRFLKKTVTGRDPNFAELQGYRGNARKLMLDEQDSILVYNKEKHELAILKKKLRLSRPNGQSTARGVFYSKSLDSTMPEILWHKLELDFDLPRNSQIVLSYMVSDSREFAVNGVHQDIDRFIEDNAVNTGDKIKALENLHWEVLPPNPKDALIDSIKGRYLWLRVEFLANDDETPLLKSIIAYFPEDFYTKYLPAVFRRDGEKSDFLKRYLAIFQSFLSEMEWRIDNISRYFDADAADGGFLRWLSTWVAVSNQEVWEQEKLKRFVKMVPLLYKKRGTREGIEAVVELYTGHKPIVFENYLLKRVKAGKELDEMLSLYGDEPYTFTVILKHDQGGTHSDRVALRKLLNAEKPAHSKAILVVLQPWIYPGMHTYLGINTYLSKPDLRLEDESADVQRFMPRDTQLNILEEAGKIQNRSRVGMDTKLN